MIMDDSKLRRALLHLRALLKEAVGSLPAGRGADAFSDLRLDRADALVLLDGVSAEPLAAASSLAGSISGDWFPAPAVEALGLDEFDVATLLIALAPELESVYERIYGFLSDDLTIRRPTVELVTRLLCLDAADRIDRLSRFLPGSPLMSSGLLRMSGETTPRGPLSSCQLSVDPSVLKLVVGDASSTRVLDRAYERGLPGRTARREVWRHHLRHRTETEPSDELVDAVATLLPLCEARIAAIVRSCVPAECRWSAPLEHELGEAILEAYQPPSPLGRHVPIRRSFEHDLILPADVHEQLEKLRRRMSVHDAVRQRSPLVGGITVLFTGPSGTGKTLAAECLARALGCDLFRVSASRLYDKYVGETEKNIDRMFELMEQLDASASGAKGILLVDEAEWLFSKRVEGRDAHDHFLNVRVAHLLQRLETYRGIAILTTNLPANLDSAFRRRWFQHVRFRLPDEGVRHQLWLHALAQSGLVCHEVEVARLAAAFALSGGSIRNVVVMATYDACADGKPLQTRHLRDPIMHEYQKMGHDIDPGELMTTDAWRRP